MGSLQNFKFQTSTTKYILIIYIVGFLLGGIRHWIDIIHGGLFPYHDLPLGFNIYLTSLALIDFLIIFLLIHRTQLGLIMSVAIMATDLAVDLKLCSAYWQNCSFQTNIPLQLIAAFTAFVFITAPVLIFRMKRSVE